jgi:hypothetical protein
MSNKIQIKRSSANAVVSGLSSGELAFTQASNTLWIGSPLDSTAIPITGARYPGTLTANQALVANATSGIDKVIVANLVPTQITANGGAGSSGYLLASGASGNVYWVDPGTIETKPDGSNTYVQYNNSGALGASANFTYNNATEILYVSNSVATIHISGNNNNTNITTNYGSVNGAIGISTDLNVGVTAGGNISAPGTATINIGTTTINSIFYSATANNSNNFGGDSYATFTGYITGNSGTAYTNAMSDSLSRNGTYTGNNIFQGTNTAFQSNVYFSGAKTYIAGTNTYITSNVTISSANIDATSATIRVQDAIVSGNLSVSGTVSFINTQQLVVNDNIIELASNNNGSSTFSDSVDAGLYVPTGNTLVSYYSGIARIAGSSSNTNPYFRLFSTDTNPNTSITIPGTKTTGTLEAYIATYGVGGALIANATNIAITANSSVNVAITANTLSLATALAATSGGTGRGSYTSGDILVANSGNILSVLALNTTSGYVLQSNGTALVYDILDGGTF